MIAVGRAEGAGGCKMEPEPEQEALHRQQSAAEQVIWMAQQPDGVWLPLPAGNSQALETAWLERMDAEGNVEGRNAGTTASSAARVPIDVAKRMLGEVLADAKSVRRVLKWADSSDDGVRWHGNASYTDPETVEEPLFPVQLQDLCVRNGVFAAPTEDCNRMLGRLASLHLLAGNRRVRPASLLGSPRDVAKFPQDSRVTKTAFCSWCRRVTLCELIKKNLTSRDEYVCQSCAQQGLQCKACDKAGFEVPGMACKRATFSDSCCFVHTYLSPPAQAEDAVPEGLVHQPVAQCPWCNETCSQVIDEINTAPRRSTYKCSACKQRTLPCKGKAHRAGSASSARAKLIEGPALQHTQSHLMELAELALGEHGDVPANIVEEAQRLRTEASKAVDAAHNAEHGELLQHIRELAGMPKDATWQTLGFQNEEPSTDFRATGLLGLLATVHFTDNNAELVKQCHLDCVNGLSNGSPFPFALVSINACATLMNLLEIDSPVPDSPLLLYAVKFGDAMSEFGGAVSGQQQSLELAFFRLHSAMVLKLAATWKSRAADATGFESLLAEVAASLTAFLTAPVGFSTRRSLVAPGVLASDGDAKTSTAPVSAQQALDRWAEIVDTDTVVVELPSLPPRPSEKVTPLDATWGSPLSELQKQKYRLLHRFTNRTSHTLTLVAEHTDTGMWHEQPPRRIRAGATVYWGSCGKERAFGVTTGTCGAVLYHADTFDLTLVFMRTVGPLGVDKASASVTAPLQISADTLKAAYETLYRAGEHVSTAKQVQLSCSDPKDCEYGLKEVEWTLTDSDTAPGAPGGAASQMGASRTEDVMAFCRGHPLWDDDYCFDCANVHPSERELNYMPGAPPRFCSWCFDYSPKFSLVQKNSASRDQWECNTCGGTVHKCQMSACPHLARGGIANMAGFNRMRCDRCRLGDQACAAISSKMSTMDADFRHVSTSADAMRALLLKDVPERKLALEAGMLRPFLCLVAMGWRQRRSLAMQLGWSLVETESFGNPHAEAWDIISRAGSGIQARANQSYEKVNPIGACSPRLHLLVPLAAHSPWNLDASASHCVYALWLVVLPVAP